MAALQDLLDLVVLRDIAEPAVQLGEDDQVALSGPGVGEQPLELRTLAGALAGGDAGVCVDANDLVPVRLRPFLERGGLGLDREAVDGLFLGADLNPDV